MTLIIAHRGASRAEPENTLAAFRRAVAMGADGIELDVRRTADDRLVVHHDPSLPDGRAIARLPSAGLPASVPQLDAALDACAGAFVNIEIKNAADEPDHDPSDWVAHRVASLLAARPDRRGALISSFRGATVRTAGALGLRTALLTVECGPAELDRAAADGCVAVHPHVESLDHSTVRAAHLAGLAVNTWTCDDPARIAELIDWGVDGICTNVPDVAIEIRRRVTG